MSVHPDLRTLARFTPRGGVGPRTMGLVRAIGSRLPNRPPAGVTVEALSTPVGLRTYRTASMTPGAALLWIHGGGLVLGSAREDDPIAGWLAAELGILVVSVDYRLAPEHPAPAAVEDCHAALRWLHGQPGIDRIAIAGASAGGGLAASLAQVAHDRGEVPVAFQLLVYPMLDDRSGTRPGVDGSHFRLWTQRSSRFGWASYLGGQPAVDPWVPARREDLSGLPPAWIGVGTHDLFHDEDLDYARRLQEAGVPCQVEVVPGAFHGFDVLAQRRPVGRGFREQQLAAVRGALGL